jgi:putative glycosyltransferase
LNVKLSVVATLYNSASHLADFHRRVSAAAAALTPDYEIIFVNDGSPDDSLETAQRLLHRDEHIRIIDLARNFGHHKAMMTGLTHARGELVFLIDSDLDEEPELLTIFHDVMCRQNADVVYGVQQVRRGGVVERVSGWLFFKLFNLLSGSPIPQNVVTVRLMSRAYVSALVAHRERQTMIAGLWALTGFHQISHAIAKHSHSETNYSLARKVALLADSVTSFSDRPLVFIFYLGLVIIAFSSAAAGALIIRRVFFGVMFPGWASLIVSVWLLGGLTVFCLGVIGIYLSKVFIETKQRPYTIIRHVYERTAADALPRDSRDGRSVLR